MLVGSVSATGSQPNGTQASAVSGCASIATMRVLRAPPRRAHLPPRSSLPNPAWWTRECTDGPRRTARAAVRVGVAEMATTEGPSEDRHWTQALGTRMASVRRSATWSARSTNSPPGRPPAGRRPAARTVGRLSMAGPSHARLMCDDRHCSTGNDLSPSTPQREAPAHRRAGASLRARWSLLCSPFRYRARTQEFNRSQSWGCGDAKAPSGICRVRRAHTEVSSQSPRLTRRNPTVTPGAASGSVTQVDVGSTPPQGRRVRGSQRFDGHQTPGVRRVRHTEGTATPLRRRPPHPARGRRCNHAVRTSRR